MKLTVYYRYTYGLFWHKVTEIRHWGVKIYNSFVIIYKSTKTLSKNAGNIEYSVRTLLNILLIYFTAQISCYKLLI